MILVHSAAIETWGKLGIYVSWYGILKNIGVLKNLQFSQEKTCAGVIFKKPATLLKKGSSTDVFLWIMRNF